MLLSIDVGTKNLAMCVLDPNTRVIRNWEVSGVPTESCLGLYQCLLNHLEAKPWVLEGVSKVLIERQPDKNRRMKSVENFLHAYFLCRGKDTLLWDPKHKVPDVSGPGKVQYRKRKAAAVERCRSFLVGNQSNFLKEFDDSKKKDDLADCFMQALSFIDAKVVEGTAKTPKPRRPTVNQTDTKYSRANLAWFVKNKEFPKRFETDLKRYYTSIDELKSEFKI
jgi:hypothetical protein